MFSLTFVLIFDFVASYGHSGIYEFCFFVDCIDSAEEYPKESVSRDLSACLQIFIFMLHFIYVKMVVWSLHAVVSF